MKDYLKLDRVTIGYRNRAHTSLVLTDLSLNLHQGEIAALLGQSGCGKSTLLRTIAGFEPLIAGTIYLNGRIICSSTKYEPPEKRNIGYMFQDFALFPHLSAEKNIAFGLNRLSRTKRQQQTHHMLELVGLTAFADCLPNELSGGQQQRVALARALAPQPDLLLLDEPFSSLDSETTERLIPEIRKILLENGCTTFMVTHSKKEAHAMSDRMGLLEDGKITQWSQQTSDPSRVLAACA